MKLMRTTAALVGVAGVASLAAAGGSAAMATTTTPPAKDPATCASGHVPRWVRGNPGRLVATRAGDVWIWQNNGWHIRVRHHGKAKMVFGGTVTVADQLMTFKPFRLEKGDSVTLSGDSKTLQFTFNNYGHIDGIDINAHCASQVTFDLTVNTAPINPDRVHLGHGRLAALTVPVVISRR
jgi:hypothetical protein